MSEVTVGTTKQAGHKIPRWATEATTNDNAGYRWLIYDLVVIMLECYLDNHNFECPAFSFKVMRNNRSFSKIQTCIQIFIMMGETSFKD